MKKRAYWDEESDYWTPHSGSGSAHSVSSDDPDYDPVAELHKVVEEITGQPIKTARKQRMGFL